VRRAFAVSLDLLLLAAAGIIVFILLSGGGVYTIGQARVSLRSADNPLLVFAVLLLARYRVRTWAPWLGVWPTARVWDATDRLLHTAPAWARSVDPRPGARAVLALALCAFALKCWYAATSPGFYSGDDVEIHEMSLGTLLHMRWSIWDLRNPTFPLGIVFPAQYAASVLGIRDVGMLVIAGRVMVAAISSAGVWLVWRIGRRCWSAEPGYAIVAAALFASAKLSIAFGSTELPRPVSTVFVLAGFLLLQHRRVGASLAAGIVLGVAACLRFSEIVFLLPAVALLAAERRWRDAVGAGVLATLTMLLVLGFSDAWYWGDAFHSVRAAIDYTLVQRGSSRGFEPAWWYLAGVAQWSTLPVAALALAGCRTEWRLALWAILPLLMLSTLPHKEARYMIPAVPFVCLLAAEGLRRAAAARRSGAAPRWLGPVLVTGLGIGLVHDAAHYRLPRSNAEVRFLRMLQREGQTPPRLVAEQAWRIGSQLYLPGVPLADLDPVRIANADYLGPWLTGGAWALIQRRTLETPAVRETLARHGYHEVRADPASGYVLWRP
jgi:hypothetical protein